MKQLRCKRSEGFRRDMESVRGEGGFRIMEHSSVEKMFSRIQKPPRTSAIKDFMTHKRNQLIIKSFLMRSKHPSSPWSMVQ